MAPSIATGIRRQNALVPLVLGCRNHIQLIPANKIGILLIQIKLNKIYLKKGCCRRKFPISVNSLLAKIVTNVSLPYTN